jgi:GH24 family phage-related lysozyme (muramidase)
MPRLLGSHEMNEEAEAERIRRQPVDQTKKDSLLSEGGNMPFNWPPHIPQLLGAVRSPQFRNRNQKGQYAPGYLQENHVPRQENVHENAKGFGPNLEYKIVDVLSSIDQNIIKFHQQDHEKTDEQLNSEEESRLTSKEQQDELIRSVKLLGAGSGSSKALVPHKGSGGGIVAGAMGLGKEYIKDKSMMKLLGVGGGSVMPAMAKTAVSGIKNITPGLKGASAGGGSVVGMLGGSILALAIDAVLGVFKSSEWNVSKGSGAVGGLMGGSINDQMLNTFGQMGKWALVGATAGSVVPGVGTLAGGILGAAFGGIMGMIGGQKIADFAERTGIGRYVESFTKMVGSIIIAPARLMWKGLKVVAVGLKFVGGMLGFVFKTVLSPLQTMYEKDVEPILGPLFAASKKFFGFFSDIFDWISNTLNGDTEFDKIIDKLLNNEGNIFEDVMKSFQQSFLNFAAGMLEKVPSWVPGSSYLHDTAAGFRKQSSALGNNSAPIQVPPSTTKSTEPDKTVSPSASESAGSRVGGEQSKKIDGPVSSTPAVTPTGDSGIADLAPKTKEYSGAVAVQKGAKMSTSAEGVEAIKKHESFQPNEYWDRKGWSIGYGHLQTEEERKKFKGKITKAEATELLKKDIKKSEDLINARVKVPITQTMFDSLVDFGHSGPLFLKNVIGTLNTGDYSATARHMKLYVKARKANGQLETLPGLVARRKEETDKFLASMPELNGSGTPALAFTPPRQGREMMESKKKIEDAKAEQASRETRAGNVVIAPSKTEVNNTAVIAQQHDTRNTENTFRDARYRSGYNT